MHRFYSEFVILLAAFMWFVCPLGLWDSRIVRMQLPMVFSLLLPCFFHPAVFLGPYQTLFDGFAEVNLMHNAFGRLTDDYTKFMKTRRCFRSMGTHG